MRKGRTPWGHRLNWIPDRPHGADRLYITTLPKGSLPPGVDLRGNCPPVVDQGQIGSCTGNAIACAVGYLEIQKDPIVSWRDGKFDAISRLFIYWNERAIEGDTHQDAGAQIRDGVASVADKGVCRESSWPYAPEALFVCPEASDYSEAYHHKISSYLRLDNTQIEQLKTCIANGFPFVFGITVYESFFWTASDGIVPMPDPYSETVEGGHALCCVGYDDSKQAFIVRNSWGTSWGDRGDCYIPYDYLTSESLADDFWTLRR